jgi:hypothetical protein
MVKSLISSPGPSTSRIKPSQTLSSTGILRGSGSEWCAEITGRRCGALLGSLVLGEILEGPGMALRLREGGRGGREGGSGGSGRSNECGEARGEIRSLVQGGCWNGGEGDDGPTCICCVSSTDARLLVSVSEQDPL